MNCFEPNSTIADKSDYDFLRELNVSGNAHKMGFYQKNTNSWVYSKGLVSENTWMHVAITLSGGTLAFNINGISSGTAAIAFLQEAGEMDIGRQQPSACKCNHFNGSMDELRIWNIVRTQTEIQANTNSIIAANSTGLVAQYKFDEGTATTSDATRNNNHATLVNSPSWLEPSTSRVNAIVWSPGGATTPCITVTNSGNYLATVSGCNGCFNYTITALATSSNNTAFAILSSPTDDYSSSVILKTASSTKGKIRATNVSYKATNMELNPGFKAEAGIVFMAETGGCN